jgi:hypothetical protein
LTTVPFKPRGSMPFPEIRTHFTCCLFKVILDVPPWLSYLPCPTYFRRCRFCFFDTTYF